MVSCSWRGALGRGRGCGAIRRGFAVELALESVEDRRELAGLGADARFERGLALPLFEELLGEVERCEQRDLSRRALFGARSDRLQAFVDVRDDCADRFFITVTDERKMLAGQFDIERLARARASRLSCRGLDAGMDAYNLGGVGRVGQSAGSQPERDRFWRSRRSAPLAVVPNRPASGLWGPQSQNFLFPQAGPPRWQTAPREACAEIDRAPVHSVREAASPTTTRFLPSRFAR